MNLPTVEWPNLAVDRQTYSMKTKPGTQQTHQLFPSYSGAAVYNQTMRTKDGSYQLDKNHPAHVLGEQKMVNPSYCKVLLACCIVQLQGDILELLIFFHRLTLWYWHIFRLGYDMLHVIRVEFRAQPIKELFWRSKGITNQ